MPDMKLYSLDELLEKAVLAIYRRWYELPRRAAIPQFERLCAGLATSLDGLGAPPDVTVFEQAMITFAQEARRLPGVETAGGGDLRKLAAAAPPSAARGTGRGGPLLKITNATPDRIGALAIVLRQPEPPLYAIGRMYYVPDKAALAWNDIWIALQEGWDRLPETTRQQADAIAGQLATEAQVAAPGKDFQAAHERALKALEQIPEVVRAIAPAFLKCKTVDQPDPRRSADLGWSGRGARGEGPAAAPVEPEAFGGDGEESEKLRIDFFTDIRFPQKVKQAETQWLTVRLTLLPPADSIATTMATVEFAKKKDEPPPPEVVEVRVTAPDFSEVTGDWARTITVYYDRDSQPAVFLLTSDLPGPKRVTVDFYHKGRMIGSAKFLTEVHAGATVRAPAPMERAAQFVPLEANPPAPADLELRVTKGETDNRLLFTLNSSLPQVPFHAAPMGEVMLNSKDPMAFLTRQLDRLSQLAATDLTALPEQELKEITQEIVTIGEGLFEQLMPPALQEAYWQTIKPLREQKVIQTLLITSDEPWIPWELVKPYRWDRFKNDEETDGFLVETFRMSRWLSSRGPAARLEVKSAALIMPELNLPNVQREKIFFDALAQRRQIEVGAPLQLRGEVLDMLRNGGFQVLHFATHGQFNSEDADQSQLELADGTLIPADLQGSGLRGIRKGRPLVFLNACNIGRSAFGLTGLGGWADKLFNEAQVSAFVGTLWEVTDDLAGEFSAQFYDALAAGKTLSEALHTARLHIRELAPANPTWLAYTLYGDPNATVVIGT